MPKRRGPKYTAEEAEARFPEVVKRLALVCVDCLIKLDTYPINSLEIESHVHSMRALSGHIYRLAHVVYREAAIAKLRAEGIEP